MKSLIMNAAVGVVCANNSNAELVALTNNSNIDPNNITRQNNFNETLVNEKALHNNSYQDNNQSFNNQSFSSGNNEFSSGNNKLLSEVCKFVDMLVNCTLIYTMCRGGHENENNQNDDDNSLLAINNDNSVELDNISYMESFENPSDHRYYYRDDSVFDDGYIHPR